MKVIEYGFIDVYGNKWQDEQVDLYNKVSHELFCREQVGMPVYPEDYANKHRIYNIPQYSKKIRSNA
jgi:hypothetical protein